MGATCSARRAVIDVIPDKTVLLEIVDTIVEFEDMLKRGEQLTTAQRKEKQKVDAVEREMKGLQKFRSDRVTLPSQRAMRSSLTTAP